MADQEGSEIENTLAIGGLMGSYARAKPRSRRELARDKTVQEIIESPETDEILVKADNEVQEWFERFSSLRYDIK